MSYEEYTLIFDIDGTICPIKKKDENYSDLVPYFDMVQKLKYYKQNGAKIILFTSRNMNTYKGNIGLINKNTAVILQEWLNKWNIPYDEIYYGKIWPGHKGFYIDDRSVRPNEFLNYSLENLTKLCDKSKCDKREKNNE